MPVGRPSWRSSVPGRDNPRPGGGRPPRASGAGGEGESTLPVVQASPPPPPPRTGHGLGLTRRALVLVAVLAVLGLSYARSLTLYLSQQRDIEATREANAASAARIAQLEDEVARWSDPDYVRAQARQRLGWVMPGEIGYRVILPDGTILGATPATTTTPQTSAEGPWYQRLWASVESADLPLTNAEAIPADGTDTVITPGAEDTPG